MHDVQLQAAILSDNKLEGSLPEAWSNLTSVSLLHVVSMPGMEGFSNITCNRDPKLTLLGCAM